MIKSVSLYSIFLILEKDLCETLRVLEILAVEEWPIGLLNSLTKGRTVRPIVEETSQNPTLRKERI